jgi:hypothetical protein
MAEATVSDEKNVRHIVNNLQDLKARIGMKYRSRCGMQLTLTADAQYPTEDAPNCPKCVATMPPGVVEGWGR